MRLLLSKLNKERKKQAQKIDILCNDFVTAQRNFIKRLNTISFTANFYEAIVGTTDFDNLIHIAAKLIKNEIPDATVAFFLYHADNPELHLPENNDAIPLDRQHLESCFTAELVGNICKSNRLCTLDDMFAMGLQGNLVELNKISAVTIPLQTRGFILIYRSLAAAARRADALSQQEHSAAESEKKLTVDELNNIAAITSGLSRAIFCCQALPYPVD